MGFAVEGSGLFSHNFATELHWDWLKNSVGPKSHTSDIYSYHFSDKYLLFQVQKWAFTLKKYVKMQCPVCTLKAVQKLSLEQWTLNKRHIGDIAEVV